MCGGVPSVIPVLGRLRQEDLKPDGCLDYIETLLPQNQTKENKRQYSNNKVTLLPNVYFYRLKWKICPSPCLCHSPYYVTLLPPTPSHPCPYSSGNVNQSFIPLGLVWKQGLKHWVERVLLPSSPFPQYMLYCSFATESSQHLSSGLQRGFWGL